MVTINDVGVPYDVDVLDRVTNQLFGCGLTLAAVLSRPHLDDEIAKRLRDVVEQLDATLVVIRGAAFDRYGVDQPVHR
jgi:cob(I)alamin adenosyltransferase